MVTGLRLGKKEAGDSRRQLLNYDSCLRRTSSYKVYFYARVNVRQTAGQTTQLTENNSAKTQRARQ